MYVIGNQYTRHDIYEMLSIPEDKRKGDWLNGYHRHEMDYYIFCNIGVAGRTGHDYENAMKSDNHLKWYGKTGSHFKQPTILNMLSGQYRVLIFHRSDDRDPFTYAGMGRPVPHFEIERPVRIDWFMSPGVLEAGSVNPEEYAVILNVEEGRCAKVYVNRYERSSKARKKCIEYYGAVCKVCGLDFENKYGEIGRGFIHVHHIKKISDMGSNYVVNPIDDLVPVCPNCHAMLHKRTDPYTVDELIFIMKSYLS